MLQLLRSAPLLVRHTVCQEVISLLHLNPDHIITIISHPGWESLFLWLLTTEEEGTKKGKKKKNNNELDQQQQQQDNTSSDTEQQQQDGTVVEQQQQEREKEAVCDEQQQQQDKVTVEEVQDDHEVSDVNKYGHSPPHRQRTGAIVRRTPTTPAVAWYTLHGLEDEVWRSCAVVTETIVYVLWQVVRTQEDKKAWKLFGTVFASLDDFSSCHCLIAPVRVIKQR